MVSCFLNPVSWSISTSICSKGLIQQAWVVAQTWRIPKKALSFDAPGKNFCLGVACLRVFLCASSFVLCCSSLDFARLDPHIKILIPNWLIPTKNTGYQGSKEFPWFTICTCCHISSMGEKDIHLGLHWEATPRNLFLVPPGRQPCVFSRWWLQSSSFSL